MLTAVIVKDSHRYAETGGRGYGSFNEGSKVNTLDAKAQQACHQCHISRKTRVTCSRNTSSANPCRLPAYSEENLRRKLELPAHVRLARDLAEIRVSERCPRPSEYRMIQRVEHRYAELQLHFLCN